MKQRVITAMIGLVIFLAPLIMGGPVFMALVAAMAIVGFIELMRMNQLSIFAPPAFIGLLLSLILLLAGPQATFFSNEALLMTFVVAVWLLLLITVLSANRYDFDKVAFVTFTALYIGFGLHFFLAARLDEGFAFVLFVLIAIWATDTGAYLFGRKFGKRPLWPKISPKKTVEGALGDWRWRLWRVFFLLHFGPLFLLFG
nr:phosphatidate cytidylyltransferase [Salicibibacter halophilus]